MRALVYHGPGRKAWEEAPDPEIIDAGDIIVRVDATTICGTDLHILKGDVPEVIPGRILGHEAVGTVDEVGDGVRTLSPGDRVLVSCISACGTCRFCREGRYGQIDAKRFVTPHFGLDEFEAAYDVFERAADTGALKVVLIP
jgi:alcohol dehydrogenase